jgi:hypothetical protein
VFFIMIKEAIGDFCTRIDQMLTIMQRGGGAGS